MTDEEVESWRKSMHEQIQHYEGLLSKRDEALKIMREALKFAANGCHCGLGMPVCCGPEDRCNEALAAATKILGE